MKIVLQTAAMRGTFLLMLQLLLHLPAQVRLQSRLALSSALVVCCCKAVCQTRLWLLVPEHHICILYCKATQMVSARVAFSTGRHLLESDHCEGCEYHKYCNSEAAAAAAAASGGDASAAATAASSGEFPLLLLVSCS